MAVEATYMNLLPSQLLTNREIMKSNQQHHQLIKSDYMYSAQMNSALPLPATMPESIFYRSNLCDPNKAESGLSYHVPLQGKRSRDFTTELTSLPAQQKNKMSVEPSLLNNQEILYQFQNQQSELDQLIAQHTQKMRMEMEEQKIRQSRMLVNTIQEATAKKLKEKDEQILKMGKLYWALQDKVKTLCVENQIWKEMAQSNETAANQLRSNLEQVLAQVNEECGVAVVADDAQSNCGSNHEDEAGGDTAASPAGGGWFCKNCGVRESVVLLLPCRHLCLCTLCGSTVRNCPICNSGMDASVHVNLC